MKQQKTKKLHKTSLILYFMYALFIFAVCFMAVRIVARIGPGTSHTDPVFGVTINFPKSWDDKYHLIEDDAPGLGSFVKVYEKESYDFHQDEDDDYGWLFSIYKIPKAEWDSVTWRNTRDTDGYSLIGQKKENGVILVYIIKEPSVPEFMSGSPYRELKADLVSIVEDFFHENDLEKYVENGEISNVRIYDSDDYEVVPDFDLRRLFFMALPLSTQISDLPENSDTDLRNVKEKNKCVEISFRNPKFEFISPDEKNIMKSDFDKVLIPLENGQNIIYFGKGKDNTVYKSKAAFFTDEYLEDFLRLFE